MQLRSMSVGLHLLAVDVLYARDEGLAVAVKLQMSQHLKPILTEGSVVISCYKNYVRISKNAMSLFLHSHLSFDL